MANDSVVVMEGAPFAVSAPFNSDPCADIVLRSSDNFEFQMRKAMLSFISPALSDMISLGPYKTFTDTTHGAIPYIHLPETGLVLDSLLRYAYPLPSPVLNDVDLIITVFNAAEKYALVYVVSELHASMQNLRFERPELLLFLYRRACDRQQEAEARNYAWDCLKFPYSSIVRHGNREVDNTLPNLIDYHHSVSTRVVKFIIEMKGSTFEGYSAPITCMSCRDDRSRLLPKWWPKCLASEVQCMYEKGPITGRILMPGSSYITSSKVMVRRQDCRSFVPSENILRDLCQSCVVMALKGWVDFVEKLNKAVEGEGRKVKLVLPW